MDAFLLSRGVHDPYIEGLAVKPDMASQGIGSAIMVAAERAARARGKRTLGLAVGVENQRARELYDRLGYQETDLGVFDATWTVIDENGLEQVHGETCTYWLKDLD